MIKNFKNKGFKTQTETTVNSGTETVKDVKVIKYGYKEMFVGRLKEAISMVVLSFLWLLRLTFIPSLLIVGVTWFATNMIPTMAIQIFGSTGLTEKSPMVDQFVFFYLPMIAFVFVFGLVTVVLVCYTEYIFWKKCGSWIKYWFKRTGITNPFKNKEQVTK